MAQLNINVTPAFDRDLQRLMRVWSCRTKSEAIRAAVHESVERAEKKQNRMDFASLLGAANRVCGNPSPKFEHHRDVWEK